MSDLVERDVKPNATYGEIRRNPGELMEWERHRSPAYWEYRRQWTDYPKRGVVPDFPLCLDIETTNVCNLDCVMCPRTVYIARGTYGAIGMMDFDFYCRLIDEGARYGLPSVKLQYLGEPLAHPDVVKQVKYAKDAGVLDVMFNTNATLLTEEKGHALLEAGLDAIFFSVDSIYAEKFNRIRVGADYDKVVGNILRFIEIKNKGAHGKVHTRVSMTVMENDVDELVRFKDFWLQYVDVVGFGVYHDVNEDGIESPYNPQFTCAQPFQRMFIMWDGVATPCCVDDHRGYRTGDASNGTLYDIWHGKAYQRMRDAQLTGRYKEIGICRKCYVPYTELDGQVISLDRVKEEVSEAAQKQRTRWFNQADLELPDKARRRVLKLEQIQ
jgi:MoaA/NifB/PqqE/SkfB family radical SAM enzyme